MVGIEHKTRYKMAITSVECKLGMLKAELHQDKFTPEQLYLIERVYIKNPQAKLARLLLDGEINKDDFAIGCDLMHTLTTWRQER